MMISEDKNPLPKENDLLALVPEIGEHGENGTRLVTGAQSLYLSHRVTYVLKLYAERRAMSLALLKRRAPYRRESPRLKIAPRNAMLAIAPWLLLVPTQVRHAGIAAGAYAYINASRRVETRSIAGERGAYKSKLTLLDGSRISSLWTAERNAAHLKAGADYCARELLTLAAFLQEEERAYLKYRID